jgi:molybdopterin-guanine dinucleotide biosynthesis protein A
MKIDAVLPAGGRIAGELARDLGTDVKALLRFGPDTVLERTLKTLRATGRVGRIAVVGPREISPYVNLADVALPETDSGAGNILRGLEWLRGAHEGADSERVLILTTDLPFLTAGAITAFLDACPPEMDLCVPVLNRQEFEARFARTASRYVRLRDGDWMIGCAFLIRPQAVLRNRVMIEQVFAARRSQIGMARLLGPWFVLRFLTRRLGVKQIEAKCLQLLGCAGVGIRGCAPELAFDIDYISDYRYAADQWRQP